MTDKELAQSAYLEGMKSGFNIAITELYRVRSDDNNGDVTNCIHAYEWAQYLDRIMDRSLEEAKTKYVEINK
jgi:hypothetical protein